jgi:hypothetical protein
MRCYWTLVDAVGEPSFFDETREEQGPRARTGPVGESWRWVGKHIRLADGTLRCLYKSRARGADAIREDPQAVRCPTCKRPLEGVVTVAQFAAYQELRQGKLRHSYGTTKRLGYRPWYAPGFHRKPNGRAPGSQVEGGHVEGARGWRCLYKSRLDRKQWIEGGCQQCGRALPDTQERRMQP